MAGEREDEIHDLERLDFIVFTAPGSDAPSGYKSPHLDDLIRLQEQVARGEITLAPGHTQRLEEIIDGMKNLG